MSISTTGSTHTFTTTSSSQARGRFQVTTAEEDDKVSYSFEIVRRSLTLRVGSTAGGQEIVSDLSFPPGFWIVSFTPDATTYYIEFELPEIGTADLKDLQRLATQTLTLTTPWALDDQTGLRFHQSLNVVYGSHPSYASQVIERRGEASWGVREILAVDGPFAPLNASTTTMTPAARTGNTTITASAPAFVTNDAGSLIRLTHAGQFETASMTAAEETTDTIRVAGIEDTRKFFYTISGTFTGTVVLERSVGDEIGFETVQSFTAAASGSLDDEFDNQVIYYRFRVSAYTSGTITAELTYSQGVTDGVARIISVDADNQVTVEVIEPFAKTSSTVLWNRGSWSGRLGYPAAVGMQDGRLSFARSDQYWMSASDQYETFAVGPNEGDAINRSLTGKVNAAQWIKGVERLVIGTAGSEHLVTGGELDGIVTPATVYSKGFNTKGSYGADGCIIGDSVAFISRNRKRIYLLTDFNGSKYRVVDLTRLHPDAAGIGATVGFKEIAFQQEPYPRLWCVREDGQMAVLTLEPDENIACWCRYTSPNGAFQSVAVVANSPEDRVYFSVTRSDLNATVIEKLASEEFASMDAAWRLQSAVEYSGASTTTLTGLTHLEGQQVYVWGNGRQSGPYTVSSGQITCDYAVTYAIIGILYEGKWKGSRLNWGANAGTALTQNKQVKGIGMMVANTAGGVLKWGRSFIDSEMNTLDDRLVGDSYDSALTSQAFDRQVHFEGFTEEDPRLHIKFVGAGPGTVLGLVPAVSTNER